MGQLLRVLVVEDSEGDTELLLRELRRGGYDATHEQVQTAEAMRAALQTAQWDVVLSDYSLPGFSGPAALQTLQASGVDIPFILISGTVGEEIAVQAMKAGAHDYMLKENLTRLVPAIRREMRDAETRRQRRQAEAQIERQFHRLAALRSIDMAITGSLDLRVTLTVVLDHVAAQLGVDAVDVLLLNPSTQTLEYAAGRGFRTDALRHTRLRLGEGFAGQVARERRAVAVTDFDSRMDEFPPSAIRNLQAEGFVSYFGVPLIAKGSVVGVLEVLHRAPLSPDAEWLDFLDTLAGQAAIAVESARLFDGLQRSHTDLTLAYDATIEGWSRALDLRDKETEGHTRRVTELTARLARAMGLTEAELVHVRRGALLHDIGKMGIPDAVLWKPGPLTAEEWVVMRRHPQFAYDMLKPIAYLKPALDIPYCHHEKWDGTGYPRGLAGEQIPLAARAFAVVDVWDALRSDRPYRAAWPEQQVREYIRAGSGAHFDVQMVEAFLAMAD